MKIPASTFGLVILAIIPLISAAPKGSHGDGLQGTAAQCETLLGSLAKEHSAPGLQTIKISKVAHTVLKDNNVGLQVVLENANEPPILSYNILDPELKAGLLKLAKKGVTKPASTITHQRATWKFIHQKNQNSPTATKSVTVEKETTA